MTLSATSATTAIARRTLADSRVRDLAFAALFALLGYSTATAYRSDYPTLQDRLSFAHTFGGNASVRLFYGEPFDLLTVGGFTAWRAGGFLTIFAALWGMLAAVRALRGEEDRGSAELLIAAPLSRSRAFASALAGCATALAGIWGALLLGLLAARLPAGESAYLALATLAPAAVCLGTGALASQIAPSRRVALELGGGALMAALIVRVAADTTSLHWLRWLSPLGWSEEMRAFTGARPAVLALPAAAALLAGGAAWRIWCGRDLGSGLLTSSDSAPPRLRGLSSATAFALRSERVSFAVWLLGSGFFAFVIGVISKSVSSVGISSALRRQLARVGVSSLTPAGYIGLCFLFFLLFVSAFACAQVAAARHEESEERLQTLLALPLARARWLGGRLGLALGGIVVLALADAMLAWAGAAAAHAGVRFSSMLEAGVNCVPVSVLFLGIAALAFALLPRAGGALAYGLLGLAFTWQLLSGVLQAPRWVRGLSPFDHVGLAPEQPLQLGAGGVMLAVALLLGVLALGAFRRRDLIGA